MKSMGPRNNVGVEALTSSGSMYSNYVGMTNRNSVEFMVDLMTTAYTTPGTLVPLVGVGVNDELCWFDITSASTTPHASVIFRSRRGAVTTKDSGTGTISLGKRTVLYGKDDGVNVYAWQDGTALGSASGQVDWTDALAALPLYLTSAVTDAALYVNALNSKMIVYELWIKMDGILMRHYRPRWSDRGQGEIKDLAGFNDLTFPAGGGGVEDTDYRFVKSAQKVSK